ncbi:hypothetical protein [Salinicoccus bachuensis]|uniref:Uncharacterized protein n=1 Tax=Salinicoccus bachuensis TaxID=3136731 RepID=A0ABZ3CG11_9STAP
MLLMMSLFLVACGNEESTSEDVSDASASETAEETAKLEEENEELKRKKLEKENEELRKDLEEQKEAEDEENDKEDESDSSKDAQESATASKDSDDNASLSENRTALDFDINSSEVKSQLLGTTTGNADGTFAQDAITPGMSQTEVEEKYGPYDFTLYTSGASPAFYGNLAVVYEHRVPFGPGNDGSDNTIDPDYNYVDSVYYYAGVPESDLYKALGEPESYDDGSKTHNGLPYYNYEGEGDDGRYYITGATTIGTPNGQVIGTIKRSLFEENPNIEAEESEEISADDFKMYEGLINEYLYRLAAYYNYTLNDDEDDIFYYLKEGTPAYDKIISNKSSGDYKNHTTYEVTLNDVTDLGNGTVELDASRVYSHASSNGKRVSNVNYIMSKETFAIIDYTQVSDTSY